MSQQTDIATTIPRESVHREEVSRGWMVFCCATQLLLVVPYVSGMISWFYAEGQFPIRPLYYMLFLGLVSIGLMVTRLPDLTRSIFLIVALVAFRALDAALFERFVHPVDQESYLTGMYATVFMVAVFVVTTGVFYRVSYLPVLWVSGTGVLVCSLAVIAEWMGFGQFTEVPGRPAGYIGDPNNACIAITLMLGVYLTLSERFWVNGFLIALSGAAVFMTLSRSGALVYALLVLVFFLRNIRRHFHRFLIAGILSVPVAIGLMGWLAARGDGAGGGDANVDNRIAAIFKGDIDKLESSERLKDLRDGLRGVGEKPLFGHGSGAGTHEWQPHNQVVSVWVELGVLGGIPYLLLLGVLCWKCYKCGWCTVYCLIPVLGYVPFSQILMTNYAYWYAIIVAVYVSSSSVWSFRVLRPRSNENYYLNGNEENAAGVL